MRKRTRIAVVTAALLVGLVAPSFTGAARSDQVVMAGVGSGIDDVFKGAVRAVTRFFGGSQVDQVAVQLVRGQLDAIVPRFVRMPWGEVVELSLRQRWQLIHVACRTSDVLELQRQEKVDERLWQLGEELPGAIGFGVSVHNLAKELAETKRFGDQTRKAGAAALCMAADRALKQAR